MNPSVKEIALKTIEIEAESVRHLSNFIDESFNSVVALIHNCNGRVVVSGIGKSAVVGQKIVATLNSTGTPSLFMHAADAIHGDLGMIQQNDVVIVISKSGESPEIKVLVPLVKTFGNKVVAMVGNINSFLAKQADYIINTTVETEACPNNLAPTSSTTAQMVMGDVLAVSLMTVSGFTGKDFAKYHPGGNLGKRLFLKVSNVYVNNEKPSVTAETSLKEAIISISKGRLGATVVTDTDNSVAGIITDGDIRRLLENGDDLNTIKAKDICSANPKTALPEMLAVEAFELLKANDISQLVIADEANKYLGMLHLHDLIREGIF